MPTRIDLYRFNGQTRLSADTFNRVFTDVDLRIAKLESLEVDWEAATRELTALGLSRINEVLNPLLVTGEATLAELVDALENLPNNPVTSEQLTTILLGYVTPAALATALAPKADTATVNAQLSAKADTATVNSQLSAKANITYVDAQIAALDTGAEVITTITASTTLTLEQAGQVFVDASSGPITIALPASTSLVSYRFTRVDSTTNQVTINRAGTDLLGVSGVTSAPLDGAGYTLRLTANGAGRWMRTYSSPITFRWDVPGTYQWRRPLDSTHGELLVLGAGGGGQCGGRSSGTGNQPGGLGGGGGWAVFGQIKLPDSASVTVGAGGNGAPGISANGGPVAGSVGEPSLFGTIASSYATVYDNNISTITGAFVTQPAGRNGGHGGSSESDNTPGTSGGVVPAEYSLVDGAGNGGNGGVGRRNGSNGGDGTPGGTGSGGGGGGAAHNAVSGAGGRGGDGLVVITCL